jgi:hypothetical protein
MYRHCLYFGLILLSLSGFCQHSGINLGARHMGLGGASVTLPDGWSIFNNVGAMSNVTSSSAFVSYQMRFATSAFQTMGGGYVHRFKGFSSGIGFYRFGDEFFNQQQISLAIANKIQMVSLGASLNIVQYHVETQETIQKAVLNFGGIAEIIPELILGAHIANITQAEVTEGYQIPVIMKLGLSYRPVSSLMLNIEVEKKIGDQEWVKTGLEYQMHDAFKIRTGFISIINRPTFGLGILLGNFNFDYAFAHQNPLGAIHEFSLTFLHHNNE